MEQQNNTSKDHFIRHEIKPKPSRMTLIIGFVCEEGIALVSDTKMINSDTGEVSYGKKILTPLKQTPFIVGAAGYSNLFNEFYRKIPDLTEQRIRQYRILNVQELMKAGYTRQEALARLRPKEKSVVTEQQSIGDPNSKNPHQDTVNEDFIDVPYVYTAEDFIDDCKSLTQTIAGQVKHPYPLELLIGLRRSINDLPTLHHINWDGEEEEIDSYYAIGSGQPYVKMFFDKLWDFKKSMPELITHAFRVITFVQDVAKENSVGYSTEFPPEPVVILHNDDRNEFGLLSSRNQENILTDIKNEMKEIKKNITNPSIDILDLI